VVQQGRMDRIHFTAKDFSPLQSIRNGSGAYPSSYAVGSESCFPWNKEMCGKPTTHLHLLQDSECMALYIHSPHAFMKLPLIKQWQLYRLLYSYLVHFEPYEHSWEKVILKILLIRLVIL
jgi:hypothetical protein